MSKQTTTSEKQKASKKKTTKKPKQPKKPKTTEPIIETIGPDVDEIKEPASDHSSESPDELYDDAEKLREKGFSNLADGTTDLVETDITTLDIEEDTEKPIQVTEDEIIQAITETLTPEETELAMKYYTRLGEESGVPTILNTKHYLHLVKYIVTDAKGKQRREYKNIISPFDKHITARWIRQRTVVTRYGYDQQNCDYWDLLYICNRFHHLAGKEIGVFLLIHSSAMAELSLFAPKIIENLSSIEVANLLNGTILKGYIDLTSDNISKAKTIIWQDKYYKRLLKAKDESGDKQFALMADMARKLPESDRWNPPDKMGIAAKIIGFLKRPDIQKYLIVLLVCSLLVALLFGTGILRSGAISMMNINFLLMLLFSIG